MNYEIELLQNIICEIIPKQTYAILNEVDSVKLNSLIVQLIRYEVSNSLQVTIDINGYKLKKLIPFTSFVLKIHGNNYCVYRLNDYTIKIIKQ